MTNEVIDNEGMSFYIKSNYLIINYLITSLPN